MPQPFGDSYRFRRVIRGVIELADRGAPGRILSSIRVIAREAQPKFDSECTGRDDFRLIPIINAQATYHSAQRTPQIQGSQVHSQGGDGVTALPKIKVRIPLTALVNRIFCDRIRVRVTREVAPIPQPFTDMRHKKTTMKSNAHMM